MSKSKIQNTSNYENTLRPCSGLAKGRRHEGRGNEPFSK